MSRQSYKLLMLSGAVLLAGCDRTLDSVGGPANGQVQGLVCTDIAILQAVEEVPETKGYLVEKGSCQDLRGQAQATVIRTVEMPGKGRYSQFELDGGDVAGKFWIRTENIRAART